MNVDDPTADELLKAGKLNEASEALWSEFNKARDAETQAVREFERTLWFTNSGAATVTIGYITTTDHPTFVQFLGSSMFVAGILALLIMKFIGETNAVRYRSRRQTISENFFLKGERMSSFEQIRDGTFKNLTRSYKALKSVAAILFFSGCILTLAGLYPIVSSTTANNKQLNIEVVKDAA